MTNRLWRRLILAAAMAGAAIPQASLAAGKVVVGGDVTGTFDLNPLDFGGLAGNRTFFDNVRGGATRVGLNTGTFNSFATGNLQRFYQFQMGAEVTQVETFTADSLANIGLLAVVMPDRALESDQIAAIGGFVRGGGRLLLLGEASQANVSFPVVGEPEGLRTNRWLNDLLAGIGSTIRLDNNTVGGGGNLRTSDVRSDPLTAGVDQFGYGFVSSVSGGTALFGAPRAPFIEGPGPNWVFFAAETLGPAVDPIPEPASWALMIGGFGLVGAAARRVRVRAVAFA